MITGILCLVVYLFYQNQITDVLTSSLGVEVRSGRMESLAAERKWLLTMVLFGGIGITGITAFIKK